MPKVTLLCGPAGAGKSTYATKLERRGAVRLSMDEAVWADGWHQEEPPQQRLDELYVGLKRDFDDALAAGKDVVVDLSLAERQVRDEWRRLCGAAGVASELVVITAPFEVLWERVKRRNDLHEANAVRITESRLRLYLDGFDWPGDDEDARVISTG